MSTAEHNFYRVFVPGFYRHAMETPTAPDIDADTLVTDVLDTYAGEQFFDYLGEHMKAEAPRVSFSLTKTFGDLFALLGNDPGYDHV